MTDQPQTLQEKALAALAEQEALVAEHDAERRDAEAAQRLTQLRATLTHWPALAGATIDEDAGTATLDGLTFSPFRSRGWSLLLHAQCSQCPTILHAEIDTLADLAHALPYMTQPEAFDSPFDGWKEERHRHYAPAKRRPEPPPLTLTPAERAFVEALRGLLAEADAEAD